MKGNLLEIAVALILALAFTAVVNAFVTGIVTPFIAAILGEPSFDDVTIKIGDGVLLIGTFLNAVIYFVLTALVLFFILKAYNRMQRPKDEAPTGPTEVELLIETRDSLRSRSI